MGAALSGFVTAIRLGVLLWIFVIAAPFYLLGLVAGVLWRGFDNGVQDARRVIAWASNEGKAYAYRLRLDLAEAKEADDA